MPDNLDTALTTTSALKVYMLITTNDHDTLLDGIVARYSARISQACGRKFAQAVYTEYHEVANGDTLYLRNWPVTTPIGNDRGIWEDPNRKFGTSTALVEDDPAVTTGNGDYVILPNESGLGRVVRLRGIWSKFPQSIKVTYQGGYPTIPGDIVEAAHRWMASAAQRTIRGLHGVTAETNPGGGNVTVPEVDMPKDVREALTFYRRIRYFG